MQVDPHGNHTQAQMRGVQGIVPLLTGSGVYLGEGIHFAALFLHRLALTCFRYILTFFLLVEDKAPRSRKIFMFVSVQTDAKQGCDVTTFNCAPFVSF